MKLPMQPEPPLRGDIDDLDVFRSKRRIGWVLFSHKVRYFKSMG